MLSIYRYCHLLWNRFFCKALNSQEQGLLIHSAADVLSFLTSFSLRSSVELVASKIATCASSAAADHK